MAQGTEHRARGTGVRVQWVWLLGGWLVLGGGCGDYAPFVPAPTVAPSAPAIARVTVQPTVFDLLGGTVTIEAEVSDPNNDLAEVVAQVTRPDGTLELPVTLAAVGGAVYRGTYQTAGNPTEEERNLVYRVLVRATDARGLTAELAGADVTVTAAPRPKDPPNL